MLQNPNDLQHLEAISSFRKLQNTLHPENPTLLLTLSNEHNEEKSLMSFLVPSLQTQVELQDEATVVEVLADLLNISPPKKSMIQNLPSKMKSPYLTMRTQEASYLEATLLLECLLLGAGYNSFVVQGYSSSQYILGTTESKTCPYQPFKYHKGGTKKEMTQNKYKINPPPRLHSKFLSDSDDLSSSGWKKIHDKLSDTVAIKNKDQVPITMEDSYPHFFIVILPPDRDVTTAKFVDISKRIIQQVNLSYNLTRVAAIFNHHNYWVNRQFHRPLTPDTFELHNSLKWLPLFKMGDKYNDMEGTSYKKWSKAVLIPDKMFTLKYPGGVKYENYSDATVEKYSPMSNREGIILSVKRNEPSTFHQFNGKPWKQYNVYENRTDDLTKTVISFDDDYFEHFEKTRNDNLKNHQYSKLRNKAKDETKKTVQYDEYFEFYSQFRCDCVESMQLGIELIEEQTKDTGHIPLETKEQGQLQHNIHLWKASVNIVKKDLTNNKTTDDTELKFKEITVTDDTFIEVTSPKDSRPETHTTIAKTTIPKKKLGIVDILQKVKKFQEKSKKKFPGSFQKGYIAVTYNGRNDNLKKRIVNFKSLDVLHEDKFLDEQMILKIEEEYLPTTNDSEDTSIQKRIFDCSQKKHDEISITYHYAMDRILQKKLLFKIQKNQDPLLMTSDMVKSYEIDSNMPTQSMSDFIKMLQLHLDEKRNIMMETNDCIKKVRCVRSKRLAETQHVELNATLFDFEHNETLKRWMPMDKPSEIDEQESDQENNAISPYRILLSKQPSLNDIDIIKERCLKDQLQRSAIRESVFQRQLDSHKSMISSLREEMSENKGRLKPEKKSELYEEIQNYEMEQHRIMGFLEAWKLEAMKRYQDLEHNLNLTLNSNVQNSPDN